MNIKQVNKKELETTIVDGEKTTKKYIQIESEEGQALIVENEIEIDTQIEEY